MSEDELKKKLHEKIKDEYKLFIQELYDEEPEDIVRKAYEVTIKDMIKNILLDMNLEKEKLEILLKCEWILDECYDEWIDMEIGFGELIEDAIDKRVEFLIKEENEVE